MTSNSDITQKIKLLNLIAWFIPLTSLVMAALCYFFVGDDFGQYVCIGLVILAAVEFFALRSYARKTERKLERDRG